MNDVIKILLLEDSKNDKFQIKGAIKSCNSRFPNLSNGKSIEIFDFNFTNSFSTETVKQEVLLEIDDCEYASVIIDQKIVLQNGYVDGNEVFQFVKNSIPSFPAIMLTQMPRDCEKSGIVDYDKIYEKKDFLRNDSDLIKRLICNAEQYLNNINTIKIELAQFNKENIDDFQHYVELETKLNNYLPKFFTKSIVESFSEEYSKLILLINELEKYINEK